MPIITRFSSGKNAQSLNEFCIFLMDESKLPESFADAADIVRGKLDGRWAFSTLDYISAFSEFVTMGLRAGLHLD